MKKIINFLRALVSKLLRRHPKDGYEHYSTKQFKIYCDRCGDELSRYGCYTCWKYYGA